MAKKNKKKGPIRLEAVIPTLIICVLIGAYFKFFFDLNLKWGLEFAGTQVHGAEVNIQNIRSSVFGGYMKIFGVQVTNKDNPKENLVEIDKINFNLSWDGLLRGKFVVNESSVNGIKLFSPRRRPGKVLPPPKKDDSSSGALRQAETAVIESSKKQFNSNILGDAANILGGTSADVQLKNIEGELLTNKRIKELEKELDEKKKHWDERFKKLPTQKDLDKLSARYNKLKFDTKNTGQFLKDLQELDKILKQANSYVKTVDKAAKDLDRDFKKIDSDVKGLDKFVQQDMNDLQKRMKIPNVDAGDFSKNLFGSMLSEKLAPYKKYIDMAEEYMPPKKDGKDVETTKAIAPKKRTKGKNYRFPITVSYPVFWLKKAEISSKATDKGFSGNLNGRLTNLTSSPTHLGVPTVFTIKGGFPGLKIEGIDAKVTIDHTTNTPEESIIGKVDSFPVGQIKLSDSKELKLYLNNSTASSKFGGVYKNGKLNSNLYTEFNNVKYLVDSNNKDVKSVFSKAINDIPTVNLRASAKGPFLGLSWSITSNLGGALRDSIKKQINEKIAAAKAKLKADIESKIAGNKDKLMKDLNKVKGQLTGEVDKVKKGVDGQKKQISKKQKQAKGKRNSQKKKLEKKGEKAIQDLKKKFKL